MVLIVLYDQTNIRSDSVCLLCFTAERTGNRELSVWVLYIKAKEAWFLYSSVATWALGIDAEDASCAISFESQLSLRELSINPWSTTDNSTNLFIRGHRIRTEQSVDRRRGRARHSSGTPETQQGKRGKVKTLQWPSGGRGRVPGKQHGPDH